MYCGAAACRFITKSRTARTWLPGACSGLSCMGTDTHPVTYV
ncbi:Uncharacterised protein [Mycobacteroides abscessus subsp. abscessus]|nr:Uncharacterised protein [Mycobacteroides abscessus subsp. abscessus]